jgi:hypothetical protein
MRKITLQRFQWQSLCALSCIFASEPFAHLQSHRETAESADDKPFAQIPQVKSCDAVATIDSLAIELLSNPTMTLPAYINIYGQKGKRQKTTFAVWQIKRHMKKKSFKPTK